MSDFFPVGELKHHHLRTSFNAWQLPKESIQAVEQSAQFLQKTVKEGKRVYGVNTGFGKLANQTIPLDRLEILQKHLVLSHAVGTGPDLSPEVVKTIMILKANSLAQGFSGIRLEVLEHLMRLTQQEVIPSIPCQGSVGASGDLAPLAHLTCALIGVGEVYHEGKKQSVSTVYQALGLKPIHLGPKEGLAMLNGTQVSTALALHALYQVEYLLQVALISGALTVDAIKGSDEPFDEKVHSIRRSPEQSDIASILTHLLQGSDIRASHKTCERVQDPYSVRCQPQVMGACLAQVRYASTVLEQEINAVTDNPLVFAEQGRIISGGNFHAQPVAFACDALALALAEIGSLSERRTALLIDQNLSELPAFLIQNSGENSGFMIAQVTAAALASENKHLANPVSVDSIPTSANQEDHVSMATYAARRLHAMIDNCATILAVELMASCQGIDFHAPLKSSSILMHYKDVIRSCVPFYKEDRFMAPDLASVKELVLLRKFDLSRVQDSVQLFQ